ncbi:hypothetical protein HN011_005613 [Eciton burchellii]|nr:hypothetical protein HN011_005613 [Eciton burchellii]
MIRDQELLISTLRQQGVPNDVIRRQFDALLNEQRRHLLYAAQFQGVLQDDDPGIQFKRSHRIMRKKNEKDEKPEWMIHITPPRISYYELEKMRAQQKALKKQRAMGEQSLGEIDNSHVQQQNNNNNNPTKQEEMNNQIVPVKQMYFQVNPYQQQMAAQMANWSHKGVAYCPHAYQQNASNNLYCQPSLPLNLRYSYNIPHNSYYHPEQQKNWPAQQDPNLKSMNDQKAFVEPTRLCEPNGKQIESSSLLKMRVYKDVIRPQRRNNGLQDPDTIQKALEALKDPMSKRGLEYLANLTKRKPMIKLNGVQDANEIPEELHLSLDAIEVPVQIPKKILANGLENSRNPNNPVSRPVLRSKRIEQPIETAEYPRQKRNMMMRHNVQAERENGTIAIPQQPDHSMAMVSYMKGMQAIPYSSQNMPIMQDRCGNHNHVIYPYGNAGNPMQHHCQMQQQCYLNEHNSMKCNNGGQGDVANTQQLNAPGATRINRAGGDTGENLNAEEARKRMGITEMMQRINGQPEILEARTIGGVTYLPRKPDYVYNNVTVSPDQLIANGHLLSPKIL